MQHELHQLYKDESKTVPIDPIVSAASIRWGNTTLEGAMTDVVNSSNSIMSNLQQKAEEAVSMLEQIRYDIERMEADPNVDASLLAKIAKNAADIERNTNNIAKAAMCVLGDSNSFDICDQQGHVIARFENGHIKTKYFDSSQAQGESQLRISSTTKGQFDLCDPMGNVILRLKDGHIQTKNFDSGNIQHPESGGGNNEQPTTPTQGYDPSVVFKGKRMAILGDSISTFSGTMPSGAYGGYYPVGDVDSASKVWWCQVCQTLGMTWTNCSISGSTVCTDTVHNAAHDAGLTSPFAGCSTKRVNDLGVNGVPDIVICFISINDFGRGNNYAHPLGTWKVTDSIPTGSEITTVRAAYAMMLNKIQTTYKSARVFCCSVLDTITYDKTSGWPTNNSDGVSVYQWNKSLQEVAEALGATWIDMHGCGINYANILNYCVDAGLHPNAAGHKKMADFITKQLIANY